MCARSWCILGPLLIPTVACCFTYGYKLNERTGKQDLVAISAVPGDIVGLSNYSSSSQFARLSRFEVYSANRQREITALQLGKQPAGSYALQSTTVNGQPLSGNVTVTTITGNAGTASALAALPSACSAGQSPLGILANGNATGCFTPAGTYTLPVATPSILGGVKPDGTSILNSAGVISATASSVGALPSGGTAVNSSALGGTAAATVVSGAAAGATALQPAGNGASLTGITAAQVGALPSGGTAVNATELNGQSASYYQPASTAITTSNIASQTVTTATGNAGGLAGIPNIAVATIHSGSGTLSETEAVATTLFTLSSEGVYIVYDNLYIGDNATAWTATAIIATSNTTAKIVANYPGTYISLSLSGMAVQSTHGGGAGTQGINYAWIKIR